MSCEHSFASLLARTAYAQDSTLVQEARQSAQLRLEQAGHVGGKAFLLPNDASGVSSLTGFGTIPSYISTFEQCGCGKFPLIFTSESRRPGDDGKNLSFFKGVLRAYGDYEKSHQSVYEALLGLLGECTFADDAVPADALALASAVSCIISIVDHFGMNKHVEATRRDMGNTASQLVSINQKAFQEASETLSLSAEIRRELVIVYDTIVTCKDFSSTFMTELVWMLSIVYTCRCLGATIPPLPRFSTNRFMQFIAGVRGTPLSNGKRLWLTSGGELIDQQRVCRVVGYCQEGLMLSLTGGTVGSKQNCIMLNKCFTRVLDHHNPRGRDSCAGCSARYFCNNGWLRRYQNPLITADLYTARCERVNPDGTVEFRAESLVWDERRRKVLRTIPEVHLVELYDLQSLRGFIPGRFSSLFTGDRQRTNLLPCALVSYEGVLVRSTIERMDSYEVDAEGKVVSITHGPEIKQAGHREPGGPCWAASGGYGFKLDQLIL